MRCLRLRSGTASTPSLSLPERSRRQHSEYQLPPLRDIEGTPSTPSLSLPERSRREHSEYQLPPLRDIQGTPSTPSYYHSLAEPKAALRISTTSTPRHSRHPINSIILSLPGGVEGSTQNINYLHSETLKAPHQRHRTIAA